MNISEQDVLLSKGYAEALRYMDNAKETLQKARKEGQHYTDRKYVRTACGTAYNGVLEALDTWFELKELPALSKKQRKSIEYYNKSITMVDKKMVSLLGTAYRALHLDGYYDGETSVKLIESGFDAAYTIIDKIKPETFVPVKETRAQGMKRMLNSLLVSLAVMFG